MLADDLLDGLHEVVPQVPAVGDLNRVRGAGPDAFGVCAGPVTADELQPGMGAQPVWTIWVNVAIHRQRPEASARTTDVKL